MNFRLLEPSLRLADRVVDFSAFGRYTSFVSFVYFELILHLQGIPLDYYFCPAKVRPSDSKCERQNIYLFSHYIHDLNLTF